MRRFAEGVFLLTALIAAGILYRIQPYGTLGGFFLATILGFFVTLVHELGHAAAVWRLRGRVLEIAVGPFSMRPSPFRIGAAGPCEGDIGGFVSYRFDGWETSRKDFLVAAAGPAANVVLTLVLIVLLWAFAQIDSLALNIPRRALDGGLPPDAEFVAYVMRYRSMFWDGMLTALAVLSAGAAIANLIPYDQSDGQHMLDWYRSRSIR